MIGYVLRTSLCNYGATLFQWGLSAHRCSTQCFPSPSCPNVQCLERLTAECSGGFMCRACLRQESHREDDRVVATHWETRWGVLLNADAERGHAKPIHICFRSCSLTGLSITRSGSSVMGLRLTDTDPQHGEAKHCKRKGPWGGGCVESLTYLATGSKTW